MVCSISLQQLITLLAAQPCGIPDSLLSLQVAGVSTDSRHIQPGEVFLALRGDRFDGHEFVPQVVQQGAVAAIVDHPLIDHSLVDHSFPNEAMPLLVVKDTLQAYQAIGRWWRDQVAIPVVAVTGSVGKTTTKELIAAVLATQGTVLKTQANYNNEIGVPKTLLELGPE
ncbi:MAG TPA: Mur ligase family protein, partial [Allocoleopsis sp.]